jgi:hypothetical protein
MVCIKSNVFFENAKNFFEMKNTLSAAKDKRE